MTWPSCSVSANFRQNEAFIYYSGFTEVQLLPGHNLLVEKLKEPSFDEQYIYKKYLHKKFLKVCHSLVFLSLC